MEKTQLKSSEIPEGVLATFKGDLEIALIVSRVSYQSMQAVLNRFDTVKANEDTRAACAIMEQASINLERVLLDNYLDDKGSKDDERTATVLQTVDITDRLCRSSKGCNSLLDNMLDILIKLLAASKRKLFFPKYKAMFDLMAKQIKADTVQSKGPFWYQDNILYFNTAGEAPAQTKKP